MCLKRMLNTNDVHKRRLRVRHLAPVYAAMWRHASANVTSSATSARIGKHYFNVFKLK